MGSRSVRLDEETEGLLEDLVSRTGLSVSEVLKSGVSALHQQLRDKPRPSAWEFYRELDLGPGGYAIAPARDAKRAVAEQIRKAHRK